MAGGAMPTSEALTLETIDPLKAEYFLERREVGVINAGGTGTIILDGEEFGGIGSSHLSNQMNNGNYGVIDWILNLELTGLGGKDFLICNSNLEGKLSNIIRERFECDTMRVPFNDSVIFRASGFDSLVINPLPRKDDGTLDTGPLWLCHSIRDSVDKISIEDMKVFTEEVLVPIVS